MGLPELKHTGYTLLEDWKSWEGRWGRCRSEVMGRGTL